VSIILKKENNKHGTRTGPVGIGFGHNPHCNENPIYVFPEKELCGLSPTTFMYL
jgi:hypothetical protein